jgi:hypothetical protein
MKGRFSSRRWRATGVLALGVVVGVMLVAPPAGAHFKASIRHIWHHIKPQADKRYLRYNATLPPGRTLTGSWSASTKVDANLQYAEGSISFAMPLASAPTVIVVPNDASVPMPAGCSGTLANPQASPGKLCIFVGWTFNTMTQGHLDGTYSPDSPVGAPGAGRHGAVVVVRADNAGVVEAAGTYAVTAPTG